MATDDKSLPQNVIDDVRAACSDSGRPTNDAEVIRALDALHPDELAKVHRLARSPLEARLGPDALVDLARGTPRAVAEAREQSGYYRLRDERDALATVARNLSRASSKEPSAPSDPPTPPQSDSSSSEDDRPTENAGPMSSESAIPDSARIRATPPFSVPVESSDDTRHPTQPSESTKKRGTRRKAANDEETQELLTLFAYHRDPVRVAQELGLNVAQLHVRIEELGLRRRVNTILERTTDIDLFQPQRFSSPKAKTSPAPLLRKRGERPEPKVEETVEPEPTPEDPQIVWEPQERLEREEQEAKRERARHAATTLSPRREYVRAESPKKTPRRPAKAKRKKLKAIVPEITTPEPKESLGTLFQPESKSRVEELLETEKANVRMLAAKLSETIEGPGGRDLNEGDIRSLFEHHGLTAQFEEKELANTRFLMGFHQGARGKLANALLMTPTEFKAYLTRLGLTAELENIRAERARQELGRSRLRDRFMQVLTRAPYLDDLGVLPVIDRDVKDTLLRFFAENRALATDAQDLGALVQAETGLEKNQFTKLLRRYELLDHAQKLMPEASTSADASPSEEAGDEVAGDEVAGDEVAGDAVAADFDEAASEVDDVVETDADFDSDADEGSRGSEEPEESGNAESDSELEF